MWLYPLINTCRSLVTSAMEHALLACCPCSHHSASWDPWLLFLPLSYCPTWLSNTLISLILPCTPREMPTHP